MLRNRIEEVAGYALAPPNNGMQRSTPFPGVYCISLFSGDAYSKLQLNA